MFYRDFVFLQMMKELSGVIPVLPTDNSKPVPHSVSPKTPFVFEQNSKEGQTASGVGTPKLPSPVEESKPGLAH